MVEIVKLEKGIYSAVNGNGLERARIVKIHSHKWEMNIESGETFTFKTLSRCLVECSQIFGNVKNICIG